MRFGTGQLEKLDEWGNTPSLTHLRSQFLEIAGKLKPEIVQDLETKLLPLYNKIPLICYIADKRRLKQTFANDLQRRQFVTRWADQHRPIWYELEERRSELTAGNEKTLDGRQGDNMDLSNFITKMFEWSKTHNLDASWCRRHAYDTLDLWSVVDEYRKALIWQLLPWDLRNNTVEMKTFQPEQVEFETKIEYDLAEQFNKELTFYPTFGGRDTILESLTELKEKVNLLVRQTKRFMGEREAAAKRAGYKHSIEKDNTEHIKYFAEVQILDTRYSVLADRFFASADAERGQPVDRQDRTKPVRKAVNEMSRHLGLPLKTGQSLKGRRSGAKIIKKNKPTNRRII